MGFLKPADSPRSSAAAVPNLVDDRHGAARRVIAKLRRKLALLGKIFVGMVLCQSLPTSILVIGWSYRVAHRAALQEWRRLLGRQAPGEVFAAGLGGDNATRPLEPWPNWFIEQPFASMRVQPSASFIRGALRKLTHSLWLNGKFGIQAIVNTWVVTLPGCVLWLFAWYDGWNNSFNKGYEQAAVGPLTGILGVLLFIAVMFFLPMAQARQAVTGEWRSFYQFRFVWRLIRARWLAALLLATLYTLLSLPVNLLKTLPVFLPQINASLNDLTAAQAEALLKNYFFWNALAVFPAYVVLRVIAARIYARGLVAALQSGALVLGELCELERNGLQPVGLLSLAMNQPARRPWPRRFGSAARSFAAGVVLAVVWFAFVAQIFIAEFLNFHPVVGWLNQPLVQLPWFHYLP